MGNEVAKAVWEWIIQQGEVELVPWTKSKHQIYYDSNKLNPLEGTLHKSYTQEGYKNCLHDLTLLIEERVGELQTIKTLGEQ